jgi:2-phospho-L-lactate guanylyltransferase
MRMTDTLRCNRMSTPGLSTDASGAATRPGEAVVVVPVKAFRLAKVRLSDVMDPADRAALARAMAARVLRAAAPLPVTVVCDDDDVASWAREQGAAVVWTPGTGLNGAVAQAVARAGDAGVARVVVSHADLPFATGLAELAVAGPDEVVLVPDRRRDGTNVLSVPTDAGFRFSYGPGSFARHLDEVGRVGRRARVVESEQLGWDVDDPEDLDVPAHLGSLPTEGAP